MKHMELELKDGFDPVCSIRGVQAAQMVLSPGTSTGGDGNRHAGADQWLFVVSGTGLAIVNNKEQALRAGSLLVIERGEEHEIQCSGAQPLRTVNFYSPPAYDVNGNPLPAGKD